MDFNAAMDGGSEIREADELPSANSGCANNLVPCGGQIGRARIVVLRTANLLIEQCSLPSDEIHVGHSPNSQIVLSYHGAFRWKVGSQERLIDTNNALLVGGGEEFFADHPIKGLGHGNIIITPSAAIADELFGARGQAKMTCPMSRQTRLWLHSLLIWRRGARIKREECALALMSEIASSPHVVRRANRRIVERAKEILHSYPEDNLSLSQLANMVGVSPVYLTQLFSRSEGIPLHRYQQQLRLSRALVELPRCDNLTRLALDLGFASHSHLTATFTSVFGLPPSAFRSMSKTA